MDIYRLERDLIEDEGWRSKPYKCTAGHWTIGVGHKMMPHELRGDIGSIEWTSEQVFNALRQDAHIAVRGCEFIFGRSRFNAMPDARKRALANMCFQLGADGLSKFKRMIAAIFDGDWEQAAIEALDSKWAKRDTPIRAQKVATLLRLGR